MVKKQILQQNIVNYNIAFRKLIMAYADIQKVLCGSLYDTKTSQGLRMLSSVTRYCQSTKIVMNSGTQLSEL